MARKCIIGVMGGDENVGAASQDAKQLGALIIRAETILLTGGRPGSGSEVKNAAMQGANDEQSPGKPARLIGILPGDQSRWDTHIPHTLFLTTGLSGKERDAINGMTPDVLVFFAGSSGTLCELTFALLAEKPILCWKATKVLHAKFKEHTTRDDAIDDYLHDALEACRTKLVSPTGVTRDTSVDMLKVMLDNKLRGASDFNGTIDQVVNAAMNLITMPLSDSGFPGFQSEPGSKQKFEAIVRSIS
ncbi:MAG: hypothetical protein JWL69_370 [Phycisphaerales bacterium]|nr:hypothetical protein [Phycisphaerales bacterium]MDB5357151.1 hypothetical protein [Phycisphaerales bacterium]